jgi:hypothetical protein
METPRTYTQEQLDLAVTQALHRQRIEWAHRMSALADEAHEAALAHIRNNYPDSPEPFFYPEWARAHREFAVEASALKARARAFHDASVAMHKG